MNSARSKLYGRAAMLSILCLLAGGCLGIRPGGPAPAVNIAAFTPQELLINPREPLPKGVSCRVAVGTVLVARQSLLLLDPISQQVPNEAKALEDTSAPADIGEPQFCFDKRIQSEAEAAVERIFAREPALQVVIVGEDTCAKLMGTERNETVLSNLGDFRYYVDGNVSFDERINLNRLNLNLYDMKTNQIIGTCTRPGTDISEASALAAEGILWRVREDVRLFLLKEGAPAHKPPEKNPLLKLLFQ